MRDREVLEILEAARKRLNSIMAMRRHTSKCHCEMCEKRRKARFRWSGLEQGAKSV